MIEETKDLEFVKYCMTHPYVWRNSIDDSFKNLNPKLFFPPVGCGIIYLRADDYGVFVLRPVNFVTYEVHIALLPSARGTASSIYKNAIKYVFNNYDRCARLIASIPSDRGLVIKLAKGAGMDFIGIDKKSFQRNGVLLDQHLFGISKED